MQSFMIVCWRFCASKTGSFLTNDVASLIPSVTMFYGNWNNIGWIILFHFLVLFTAQGIAVNNFTCEKKCLGWIDQFWSKKMPNGNQKDFSWNSISKTLHAFADSSIFLKIKTTRKHTCTFEMHSNHGWSLYSRSEPDRLAVIKLLLIKQQIHFSQFGDIINAPHILHVIYRFFTIFYQIADGICHSFC